MEMIFCNSTSQVAIPATKMSKLRRSFDRWWNLSLGSRPPVGWVRLISLAFLHSTILGGWVWSKNYLQRHHMALSQNGPQWCHLKSHTNPCGNIIVPHKIPLCHMLFQNKSSRHASKQDVGWVRLISLAFLHSTILGGWVTTAGVVKNSPSTS